MTDRPLLSVDEINPTDFLCMSPELSPAPGSPHPPNGITNSSLNLLVTEAPAAWGKAVSLAIARESATLSFPLLTC